MFVCMRMSDALELKLQTFVSCHVVLGIESRSSEKVASGFNFRATSLALFWKILKE